MNDIHFGEGPPLRAVRPLIDLYKLDAQVAAWTLVALCEGPYERLLLTGTARLPVLKNGDPLRCTFVDAPSPVFLDGKPGVLSVRESRLQLFGRGVGLVSIVGTVATQWLRSAADTEGRPFTIRLDLEARFRA